MIPICKYFKLPLCIHITTGNIMTDNKKTERTVAIIIHVCIWSYIFASPLLFGRRGETIDWLSYFHRLCFSISSCLVFYVNYFCLVPRLLLIKQRKLSQFLLLNFFLMIAMLCGRDIYAQIFPPPGTFDTKGGFIRPPFWPWMAFMCRCFFSLVFLGFMAVVVRLSVQWQMAERARAEAELGMREAELKNIKNQINPHFLLNTLNNIYALTAFSPEEAQKAIQELSQMLRYVLYENDEATVSLEKEIEFLQSYVALMRLRLPSSVDVQINFDTQNLEKQMQVAPLVFISLVENAFKHGISPAARSFIHIAMTYDKKIHRLIFYCQNSNHPKTASDKSPGGIGLQQVQQRLEYAYSNNYEWRYGLEEDGKVYTSVIKISVP